MITDINFNHACLEGGDAQGNGGLVSADPSIPPIGSAYYYLTDGESACGEGPLGEDALHPAPSLGACPTPP